MEGLIPYVYKAIVQYRSSTGQAQIGVGGGSWFCESPLAAYMRLPGDSERFQASEIQQLFRPDLRFQTASSSSSSNTIANSTGSAQSPLRRPLSHRL